MSDRGSYLEGKYRMSIFAHLNPEGVLWNDLNGVHFVPDRRMLEILRCFREPCSMADFLRNDASREGHVSTLMRTGMLVPADLDEARVFRPRRVVLELVRQCNARCLYCPQSVQQKRAAYMASQVFQTVLARLRGYAPRWVATAHYGESLLHPEFGQRVAELSAAGHPLMLLTNATLLTDEIVESLSSAKVFGAYFNFPALRPRHWARFMGLSPRLFHRTRASIERFITRFADRVEELGIIVNAVTDDQEQRARDIERHFQAFGPVTVIAPPSNSRAGAIDNTHVVAVHHAARTHFAGCDYVASQLHVSWRGKVYVCGHDYHQEVILGDLTKQSLEEVMLGASAVQLRREVFGRMPMGQDRLCRRCVRLRARASPRLERSEKAGAAGE